MGKLGIVNPGVSPNEVDKALDTICGRPTELSASIEAALLTDLLLDATELQEVREVVKPEMFENPDHSFIYEAVLAIDDRGEEVNYVLVNKEMRCKDDKRWQKMGGLKVLDDYMTQPMHTKAGRQYAEEIRRWHRNRQMNAMFAGLAREAGVFGTDPDRLLNKADEKLLALRETGIKGSGMQQIGDVADEVIRQERECKEIGIDNMRVRTGLKDFDDITGGFYNGELIVEGGRPGDGKTALAMNIAMNIAEQDKKVCFFSLEMSKEQTLRRFFARAEAVDADNLRVNGAGDGDIARMEKVAEGFHKLPFYFSYDPSLSAEEICARVRLQRRRGECDFVVIDYLQIVHRERANKGETTTEAIGRVVQAFKHLAVKEKIPVLLLSQLNRLGQDKKEKPELYNLRDSGEIEQIADCVFFISQPLKNGMEEFPDTKDSTENVGVIDIQKARNSACGTLRYRHSGDYTRIFDYKRGERVS